MKSVVFLSLFVGVSAVDAGQKYLQALSGVQAGMIPAALMQQLQKALSTAGSTPEVVSSVSSIVTTLEKAANDIKLAHKRTQTQIDDLVESIQLNNTLQTSAKDKAVNEDKEWVSCMDELKGDRNTYDVATQALSDAEADENQKCTYATSISVVEASVPSKQVVCNFEEDSSCPNKDDEFVSDMDSTVDTVVNSVNVAVKAYNNAALACNVATGVTATATNTKSTAKEEWNKKTSACNKKHLEAKDAMCDFQKAYDLMCSSISEYDGAKDRSSGDGTAESAPDRQSEWRTTKISQCLLQSLLDKEAIDVDACVAGVNYSQDVGDLVLDEATVDALRVQCANTDQIAFEYSGQSWTVAEPVTSAASYEMQNGVTVTSASLGCNA